MSKALRDVTNERRRQIAAEGWTPEHDDQHKLGELAIAGASYAVASGFPADNEPPPYGWPWDKAWWKPTTTRQNLIKAAALLVAEIERIDRANGVPASVDDWRTLDTAPREERTRTTVILALKDGRVVVGKWLDNSKSPMPWQGWSTNAGPILDDKVAFWQPLPDAPAVAGEVAIPATDEAKELEILYFLVERLGGHQVRVVRPGVGSMIGFSVSRRKTFAIRDLLEIVSGTADQEERSNV
jgi:hypothetical protein